METNTSYRWCYVVVDYVNLNIHICTACVLNKCRHTQSTTLNMNTNIIDVIDVRKYCTFKDTLPYKTVD